MAEVEKKKHTFYEFIYHGVDLEQLLDVSYEQMMQWFCARQQQRLNWGLQRKQHSLLEHLEEAKKEASLMEKTEVLKTHLQDTIIQPGG